MLTARLSTYLKQMLHWDCLRLAACMRVVAQNTCCQIEIQVLVMSVHCSMACLADDLIEAFKKPATKPFLP